MVSNSGTMSSILFNYGNGLLILFKFNSSYKMLHGSLFDIVLCGCVSKSSYTPSVASLRFIGSLNVKLVPASFDSQLISAPIDSARRI